MSNTKSKKFYSLPPIVRLIHTVKEEIIELLKKTDSSEKLGVFIGKVTGGVTSPSTTFIVSQDGGSTLLDILDYEEKALLISVLTRSIVNSAITVNEMEEIELMFSHLMKNDDYDPSNHRSHQVLLALHILDHVYIEQER